MKTKTSTIKTFLLAATALGATATPALAQTSSAMLEEIIVTAEKRAVSLQDTPVAVTALSQQALDQLQVSDLKSIVSLVPGLQIGQSSNQAAVDVAIRGIVSTNRTEVGDPAVAFHVDGIYSPRPQGATALLYDVERVEVLRGPQGTLFGRNSNAGVVNIITAKPNADKASGSVDLTAGNYSLFRVKGHLNLPITDTLAIRAAGYVENREGFIDFATGSKVPPGADKYDNANRYSGRVSAQWTPVENFKLFVSAERFSDQGAGTVPVNVTPLPGTKRRSAVIDSPGMLDQVNDTVRVRADYQPVESVEVSYLFGWAHMTRQNVNDNDVGYQLDPVLRALPRPPVSAAFAEERRFERGVFDSHQHELQVKSVGAERFDWLFGAFYYKEDNDIRFDIDFRDDTGTVPGQFDPNDRRDAQTFIQPRRDLSSWALFTQETFHVTDAARVTGGLRYTKDTKKDTGGRNYVCNRNNSTPATGGINVIGVPTSQIPSLCVVTARNDADKNWSKTTWMARGEYDVSADLLAYAMVNTGFKSGVIQDGGTAANPENVTNYELGLKATLLGGDLTLNNVAFYSDYSDILRANTVIGANGIQQLVTVNATKASIYGLESEASWRVSANDRLQVSAALLSAEYDDFRTVDTNIFTASNPNGAINLKGNKLPFAPEVAVTVVYEHFFDLPDGGVIVPRIQSKYQSEMFLTDFNRATDRQASYTRTDLSLRYESPANWQLEAFVQNLEDKAVKNNIDIRGQQAASTGAVPGFAGVARAFYDAPRTWGVRAAYRF